MRRPISVVVLALIFPPIFLYNFANAALSTNTPVNEILSFLALNGKRHLSVVTLDYYDINVVEFQYKFIEISKRRQTIYSNDVSTKFDFLASWDRKDYPVTTVKEKINYYTDSLVIIASAHDSSNWDAYFDLLTKVEVMSATMIFPDQIPQDKKEMFVAKLEVTMKSRFFYWIYEDEDDQTSIIAYNRVITLVGVKQVAVNKLSFNGWGYIIEDYDLQGMHILSTTVSWPPYIYLPEECKRRKLYNDKCKPQGHLVDTLNAMGHLMNFTWECHGDPNDNYGTTPTSGPANENGTWAGVVGDVFYGNYHFSMSTWVWKEERQDMFDFATYVTDQTALAITLKAKDIDYTLFTRPFRFEAWLLVGFAVIVFLLATIVPYLFAPDFGTSTSLRLIECIAFAFFMLTEIYYSGALTMFFSTAPTLPFEVSYILGKLTIGLFD